MIIDGNLIVDFQQVAAQAGRPDADPFDLLCPLAFNAPVLTRRQRADFVAQVSSLASFCTAPLRVAREMATGDSGSGTPPELAAGTATQLFLTDMLKVPPISQHGNVNKIIGKFGGADQLRNAVNQLQSLLYSA